MRYPPASVLLPVIGLLALSGCDSDDPTSPELQAAVGGLFEEGRSLQAGEVIALTGGEAQTVFLAGGADGAEYLYVPFNASEQGSARLAVEVQGGSVEPPMNLTGPLRSRTPVPLPLRSIASQAGADEDFHERLREREIRELSPRLRASGGAVAARMPEPSPLVGMTNPQVGDIVEINVNTDQACTNPDIHQGRVAAVTGRAVVVEDLANPAGGFTDEEFRSVGLTFDSLLYPVDVFNFGEPVYPEFISPRDRVMIFYTRAVNELTPPGSGSFVGGFFFARDLFPRLANDRLEGCPSSNQAPIMYLLAPDPGGEVGDARTKDFVLRVTLSTVAHELQHLINAARGLFAGTQPTPFEEVWLNEALSHIAEELMFYASTATEPRGNLGIEELRASPEIRQAFNTYQASNMGRYISYLENSDTTSLLGVDELPTRGASWAFLRYAADHEPGPDHLLFRGLVDAAETGVENLAVNLTADPIDLMQAWTVSVFTDDVLPGLALPAIYQQPSWDFRSILTAVLNEFPLQVHTLTNEPRTFTLRPGGAAFVRFRVAPGEVASIITTSGGVVPGERLRISIARLR